MQILPFKSPNHEEDPLVQALRVLLDLVQLIVLPAPAPARVQAVILQVLQVLQVLLVQAQAVILQVLQAQAVILQALLVQVLRALLVHQAQIVHTVQVQL